MAEVVMVHAPTGAMKAVTLAPFSVASCRNMAQARMVEPIFNVSVQTFKYVTCVHVLTRIESYLYVGRNEDFVQQ